MTKYYLCLLKPIENFAEANLKVALAYKLTHFFPPTSSHASFLNYVARYHKAAAESSFSGELQGTLRQVKVSVELADKSVKQKKLLSLAIRSASFNSSSGKT